MSMNGLELVRAAIEEANQQAEDDAAKISTVEEAALLGGDGVADSLMVVNVFVSLEQLIEEQTGKIVIIVSEEAMTDDSHPFSTVGSLAAYVERLLAA